MDKSHDSLFENFEANFNHSVRLAGTWYKWKNFKDMSLEQFVRTVIPNGIKIIHESELFISDEFKD